MPPGNLRLFRFLPHYLRKRFGKKYVIIESDDWGLERGTDEGSIEWAKAKFGQSNFTRWTLDALETGDDLRMLYDVLRQYADEVGAHPVITANFVTHNIDYSSPDSLKFIPIGDGFNSTEFQSGSYKSGINEGLIFPQLHGYSHYNISALSEYFKTEESREAFANRYLACRSTIRGNLAFLQGELSDMNAESSLLIDAADEFERVFGFRSRTLIPPTFILDRKVIGTLKAAGIELIQSSNRIQETDKRRYGIPYFRKKHGIVWSVRNARLDPYEGYDFYHNQCIDSIGKAFNNQSPAIIDFHRVNFSGKFNPSYRERTLNELDALIREILVRWPDARFIHSQKLLELIWRQETS